LQDYQPLGLLFFLDHRAPPDKENEKGYDKEQMDDGKMDPERIERHRRAFIQFNQSWFTDNFAA